MKFKGVCHPGMLGIQCLAYLPCINASVIVIKNNAAVALNERPVGG